MNEHIERYVPTPKDREVFNRTITLVRQQPERFREAGRWLDSGFGRKSGLWRRALQETRRSAKSKQPRDGSLFEGLYAFFRWEAAWDETLPEARRIDVLERPNRLQVACRYILLLWLLADPDTSDLQPSLTEFQTWCWNSNDADPVENDDWRELYVPDDGDDSHFSRVYVREQFLDGESARLGGEALAVLEADPAVARQTPKTKSKGKPKTRRRRASKPTPLTAKQTEVVQIVGECKGNFSEAAKRLGKHHSTVRECYDVAMAKLGKRVVKHTTRSMPMDRRGQANVADGDDRRV